MVHGGLTGSWSQGYVQFDTWMEQGVSDPLVNDSENIDDFEMKDDDDGDDDDDDDESLMKRGRVWTRRCGTSPCAP